MASFTSAISILGFPQEMYLFGSMYWLIGISYFFTQPFAAFVFVPFFHNLKITSAYEYLEKRFNNYVRIAASIIFCIQMFLYMSVVLYTPAVAVQQVTGISLWISILVTGIVCTVYTSLGGMKAVVFTVFIFYYFTIKKKNMSLKHFILEGYIPSFCNVCWLNSNYNRRNN